MRYYIGTGTGCQYRMFYIAHVYIQEMNTEAEAHQQHRFRRSITDINYSLARLFYTDPVCYFIHVMVWVAPAILIITLIYHARSL
jgi:hypothetical protein